MLTIKDELVVGIDDEVDFELSTLGAGDAVAALENAIADVGEQVTTLQVRFYEMAYMVKIGGKPVTVKQLKALPSFDYDILNQASVELEKKLRELAETRRREKAEKKNSTPASN